MKPIENTVLPTRQAKTRVLLVDKERLFRQCLKLLLELEPDIHVIGEAKDGEEAVIMAIEATPDMIIMDVDLPGLSGLKAAWLIRERLPAARILMLSMQKNEELVRESFAAGALGYALKDAGHQEFLRIVTKMIQGESITSPFLLVPEPKAASPLSALTTKEYNILCYLSRGMSNKEIATATSLSPETVKSHLRRIYTKLNVRGRAEAMRIFFVSLPEKG
ncbi:MAG: response regulator transcription factor [Candidatus Tectomicrobia bacterium]|uniref:Response regulator transcription factor n=1 Tax=Tectimicrobiota bacterium TaxID=2528274 RepID=A0A932FZ36_UNCTE|nr:response regulator transcription factor [Candidatus Tectomicrobia bacterium]